MSEKSYSKYQQKAISNYYRNLDRIALSKLQEIVTDLFLADTAKKRDRLWERAAGHIQKLDVPPTIKEHILAKKDIQILAKNLEEWLKK